MNIFVEMKRGAISKNVLRYGSIVAIILAIYPYLFFSYETVPDDLWNVDWLNTINDNLGEDAYISSWLFLQKLGPVIFLGIWFITCKHWWYHVIAIPLSMYLFQLIVVVTPLFEYLDHFEIYFVIPVVIISLSLSYIARIKIYDKVYGIDLSDLEKEISKPSDKLQ